MNRSQLRLARFGAAMMMAMAAHAAPLPGQESPMLVILRAPGVPEGTEIDVTLNGVIRSGVLPASRELSLDFPKLIEGLASIRIVSRRPGLPSRVWRNEVRLNGSGVIDYRLNPNGTGALGQWPAVTWLASKGLLDVVMNGAALGTTKVRTRVPPDREQRVEWRRDGTVVCVTTVKLALNARRTYSCDPATKAVSQP